MALASIAFARRHVAAALLLAATAGCHLESTAPGPAPTLTLPEGWEPVDRERFRAPGTRLAAWSGPDGSSLVAYRTVPNPDGRPEQVVRAIVNRLSHLPGFRVVEGRVQELAGTRAARVEVVAPGTGSEIAPSGLNKPAAPEGRELTPTREVTVGFPRPDGSLFLAWRMPESARERVMPGVEKALATLALPPSAAPSRY